MGSRSRPHFGLGFSTAQARGNAWPYYMCRLNRAALSWTAMQRYGPVALPLGLAIAVAYWAGLFCSLGSVTMRLLGSASIDSIVEAFRDDSLVVQKLQELNIAWPDTPFLRVEVLHKSRRPADRILGLAWNLYALDRTELLSKVRPVWARPGCPNHSWSLGEMLAALQANQFKLPTPNKVDEIAAKMRQKPPRDIVPLIGYSTGWTSEFIDLEDGHNRVMAAEIVGVLPPIIKMYIGEYPVF